MGGIFIKLAIIFPGWGSSRSLYQKLDLGDAEFLIVDYFNKSKLIEELNRRQATEIIFMGWSMGAILALKYLSSFKVDKLILLAPTLNFLDNQPEAIVKRIIKSLKRDKLDTLCKFSRMNFYNNDSFYSYQEEYREEIEALDLEYLTEGLYFLLTEDLIRGSRT